MISQRIGRVPSVLSMALAVISCRAILDITPGQPLEDAASGGGGVASGGKSTSKAGSDSPPAEGGGGSTAETGGNVATAGKDAATGGAPKDGGSGQPGTTDMAGAAGETSVLPSDPFPKGSCRDCMARNCPIERDACVADGDCSQNLPTWLDCTEADAKNCIAPDPGPLQDLETCGAKSCDVCRHLSDGAPSVEILTPSNGAAITLDASGLFEVSVRVHNITLADLGGCGTDKSCGHIHLNLDGPNCRVTTFYNEWIIEADAKGNANAVIKTTACRTSIADRPLELTASLSDYLSHADRLPLVQSTVMITVQ